MADTVAPHEVGGKGLKSGALGLTSTVVIGVASTAPGYSLAASLGLVTAAVGLQAPAIMLVAFLPMFFIAAAYKYLNRADPDCGTTFTWATRAFGPKIGWMGGWGIVMADLVIMPNLAGITGQYFFLLFGLDNLAASTFWVTFVGVIFILLMTWICVVGIELSARTQVALLAAEVIVLAIFAVVSLFRVIFTDVPGSVAPALEWLNPFAIQGTDGASALSALAAAVLVSVFMYWGWDTAVTANEECQDSTRTPSRAAIISVLILVANYVIVAIAAQAFRGADFLTENSDDVLSVVGQEVLGSGFNKFLIIAVLSSAAASTQTTILPAARSGLSMAVHNAAPSLLGKIHPRFLSPSVSTILFGVVAGVWYVVLTIVSENVLADSIAAVGLMISFYYGFTGYACVAYFWRYILRSPKDFVMVGLAPFLGAVMLTWVFVKSLIDSWSPEYGSSGAILGIGSVAAIGVGLLGIGIPRMLAWMARSPGFFRTRSDPMDARPSPHAGEAPPLGTYRKGGRHGE